MRALLVGLGVAVGACAPSLESRLKNDGMAGANARVSREVELMTTARTECASARQRGLPAEEAAAASGRWLVEWLAPVKADEGPRETRPDARVTKLGEALAPHSAARSVSWVFLVDESPEVDSFSVPAGTVLVTRGLLELTPSDAQLAGALAHEMAHVALRHQLENLAQQEELACQVRRYGELTSADAASRGEKSSIPASVSTAMADGSLMKNNASTLTMAFGKKRQASAAQEMDADAAAARTLHAAGFDVADFIALLPKFAATSTPLLEVSKRVEALQAVRAALPPLKPSAPAKPAAPVKKPKR